MNTYQKNIYSMSQASELEVKGDLEFTLSQEVTFWQLYIEHCELLNRNSMVPIAKESLKRAKQKLSLYLSRKTNNGFTPITRTLS